MGGAASAGGTGLPSSGGEGGGADGSGGGGGGPVLGEDVIILGSCDANSQLPTNPDLPADLFTCCLTTPLKMALRFACRNALLHVPNSHMDNLPGSLADRRSPLGEMNWIFTAITDAIAWDMLPRELFRRLFRQDLLLASLFRNFLIAQRVMARAGLYPVSAPSLPAMHHHPLWEAFDLVAEAAICAELNRREHGGPHPSPSPFFSDQLTAFDVWLRLGARGASRAPEQLPILLQVLLSPTHRLRALLLLGRFVSLGAWAVSEMLSVGIFPYILKLLLSAAPELRPPLLYIWAKVLLHEPSCQTDLQRDSAHTFFVDIIRNPASVAIQPQQPPPPTGSASASPLPMSILPPAHEASAGGGVSAASRALTERLHCTLALFVLAVVCHDQPEGRAACLRHDLPTALAERLEGLLAPQARGGATPGHGPPGEHATTTSASRAQLILWCCLCASQLCSADVDALAALARTRLPSLLVRVLHEERPELRTAALYTIASLCSSPKPQAATPGTAAAAAAQTDPASAEAAADPADAAWRIQLAGVAAAVTVADASVAVRAQLCRLLMTVAQRYPQRTSESCHQLLWLRSQSNAADRHSDAGGVASSVSNETLERYPVEAAPGGAPLATAAAVVTPRPRHPLTMPSPSPPPIEPGSSGSSTLGSGALGGSSTSLASGGGNDSALGKSALRAALAARGSGGMMPSARQPSLSEEMVTYSLMVRQAATLESKLVDASLAAMVADEQAASAHAAAALSVAAPAAPAAPGSLATLMMMGKTRPTARGAAATGSAPASPAPGNASDVQRAAAVAAAVAASARAQAEAEASATEQAAVLLSTESLRTEPSGGADASSGCIKICAALIVLSRDPVQRLARRAQLQLHALVPHAAPPSLPQPAVTPAIPRRSESNNGSRSGSVALASGAATAATPASGSGGANTPAAGSGTPATDERGAALVGPRPRLAASFIPPWLSNVGGGGSTSSSHAGTPSFEGMAVPGRPSSSPVTPDPMMMSRASGNSPAAESSAGSLPIPGGGGAAAESLLELDLGGDLYRWGTHQLASSFPSIGDHGDIINRSCRSRLAMRPRARRRRVATAGAAAPRRMVRRGTAGAVVAASARRRRRSPAARRRTRSSSTSTSAAVPRQTASARATSSARSSSPSSMAARRAARRSRCTPTFPSLPRPPRGRRSRSGTTS